MLFSIVLLGTGCSDKFDVAAPYKNVTVVYGFLDQADTAHYVRIQKAFLDNNLSAVTMAQNADSNYYSQLNVRIDRYDPSYNFIDSIHLNRVDMTAEGYAKPTGTFFNTPNYAYKFKKTLNSSYIYRLVITNPVSGEVDSVETVILDDTDPAIFRVDKIMDTNLFTSSIDFNSTLPGAVLNLSGTYTPPSGMTTNPVGILQGVLRFNWIDSNGSTHTMTPQSYNFDLGYTYMTYNAFGFSIPTTSLYSALAAGMGPAPTATYRLLDRCQLFVYESTNDFNTYLQVAQSAGTGLTGSQIEPTYTNVKGKNVLGLFTARGGRNGYVTIDLPTMDSLEVSPVINPLCKLLHPAYH